MQEEQANIQEEQTNNEEEQANIQQEQANKLYKTAGICIWITIIAIIMTIIIGIVYCLFNQCKEPTVIYIWADSSFMEWTLRTNAYSKTSKNIFTFFELRDFLDLSL